ncbi:MAG: PDZ domain-containing protein [Candidatus Zixiibacteriota bacterium]
MKKLILFFLILVLISSNSFGQNFNMNQLLDKTNKYTVSVNLVIEISFGTQTTEAESRGIGTIVSPEGLIIFDGTPINSDDPYAIMSGMQVSAEPKEIEIVMMDGTKYQAEFIGLDRFTRIGFCKISDAGNKRFEYIKFVQREKFRLGEWLALFSLLPEYVSPPLSADIGMISATIDEPDKFVLTVGFNELEMTSVLYDSSGTPVGVLGLMENPALSGMNSSRMYDSFSQIEDFVPLLGVINADQLNALIADPPKKGKPNRGWMGIYLQALTPDIAEFWNIKTTGGIIINEVVKDSPADKAGLKTGDVIIKLFDKDIVVNKEENLPIFQKKISDLGAGANVDFTILRRGEQKIDSLAISFLLNQAPLSPAEAEEFEDDNFEMKLREMVFADYSINNLSQQNFKGVVVKEVEPGGLFSINSIQPGDIIQKIDGKKIETLDEAKTTFAVIEEKKPKEVVIFVWRSNKTMFVNIKTDWQ